MKIQTEITGNEKTISLIYTKTIEGSAGNVKPGDTLFNLTKRVEGLLPTGVPWNQDFPKSQQ